MAHGHQGRGVVVHVELVSIRRALSRAPSPSHRTSDVSRLWMRLFGGGGGLREAMRAAPPLTKADAEAGRVINNGSGWRRPRLALWRACRAPKDATVRVWGACVREFHEGRSELGNSL